MTILSKWVATLAPLNVPASDGRLFSTGADVDLLNGGPVPLVLRREGEDDLVIGSGNVITLTPGSVTVRGTCSLDSESPEGVAALVADGPTFDVVITSAIVLDDGMDITAGSVAVVYVGAGAPLWTGTRMSWK